MQSSELLEILSLDWFRLVSEANPQQNFMEETFLLRLVISGDLPNLKEGGIPRCPVDVNGIPLQSTQHALWNVQAAERNARGPRIIQKWKGQVEKVDGLIISQSIFDFSTVSDLLPFIINEELGHKSLKLGCWNQQGDPIYGSVFNMPSSSSQLLPHPLPLSVLHHEGLNSTRSHSWTS